MKRFLPGFKSRRALFGLIVIALQIVGALHFTLVRHGYSAALGGVVHVHALSRAEPKPRSTVPASHETALTSDVPACGAEQCPIGNAPHGFAPRIEPLPAGTIAFGEARLLCKRAARSRESLRVFPSAPKTSPPV